MELKEETDEAVKFLNTKIDSQDPNVFLKLSKLSIKQNNFPLALRYANKVLRALGKNDEAVFYKTIALIGIMQQYPTDQNKKRLKEISGFLYTLIENDRKSLIITAYLESLFALQEYNALISFIGDNKIVLSGSMLEREITSMIHVGKLEMAKKLIEKNKNSISEDFLLLVTAQVKAANLDFLSATTILKNSKNPKLRCKAAEFAIKGKKEEEALEIIKSASPTFIDWGRLAETAASEKNYIFAFKCYEQALKIAPDNPLILNNYAWLGAKSGKSPQDKVLSMINTAYAQTPTAGIFNTYLYVLDKYELYDECQKLIEEKKLLSRISPGEIAYYLEIMKKGEQTDEVFKVMENILKREDAFWKEFPEDKKNVRKEYFDLKSNL